MPETKLLPGGPPVDIGLSDTKVVAGGVTIFAEPADTKITVGGPPVPDVYMVTADQTTILGNGTTERPLMAVAAAGGVDVEEDGAPLGSFTTLNFTGAGATASDAGGGVAEIAIPGGSGGVDVEEDGAPLGSFTTFNFTGAGATASDAGGGVAEIAIPGGIAGVDVEEDGAPLGSFTTFNFTGAGATASDAGGGVAEIAIPGGLTSVDVQEEGVSVGGFTALNFAGAGATATDAGGGVALISIPGIILLDEGVPIAGAPHTSLDFTGSVAVADAGGGVATVSITGGLPMFDTVLSPAAITFGAAFDNWNPGVLGQNTLIRCTTDGSSRNVRGLVGGVDRKVICLLNVNASPSIVEGWVAEDAAATPANRFRTAFSSGGCLYIYDGTLSRWCLMTGTP